MNEIKSLVKTAGKNYDMKLKKISNATSRRKFIGGGVAIGLSPIWSKPILNSVVLPAHAQTSMCSADITVGGPLSGHPSGSTTCQAACDAEATSLGGELCSVTETTTATGIDCSCEIDVP